MFFRPAAETVQWLDQCPTQSRERVFHFWRNDRVDRALHEAVALQTAQRLRQHFLRNAADLALKRGVTHGAPSQNLNDERGPLVRNPIEHESRRTLRVHSRSGGRFSHVFLVASLPSGASRE